MNSPQQQQLQAELHHRIEENCIRPFLTLRDAFVRLCQKLLSNMHPEASSAALPAMRAEAHSIVAASRSILDQLNDEGDTMLYQYYHTHLHPILQQAGMQLEAVNNDAEQPQRNIRRALSWLSVDEQFLRSTMNTYLAPMEQSIAEAIHRQLIAQRNQMLSHLIPIASEDTPFSLQELPENARNICAQWNNTFPLPGEERRNIPVSANCQNHHLQIGPIYIQWEADDACSKQIDQQMQTMLTNMHLELIRNAQQAIGKNPGIVLVQMKIHADEDGHPLFLSRVLDTGRGFSHKILDAWNKGTEYQSTTGGSGTYISTTRKFILDMGGTVVAKNLTKEGGGSVIIRIPLSALRKKEEEKA